MNLDARATFTAAKVKGRLWAMDPGFPALEPGDAWVIGDVMSFDDPALLAEMDAAEEAHPEDLEADATYHRESLTVYTRAGESLGEAQAYFMRPAKIAQIGGQRVPSGEWG